MKLSDAIIKVGKITDEAGSWDAVSPEVWAALAEAAGLDYSEYDDPDKLFDDILKGAYTDPDAFVYADIEED